MITYKQACDAIQLVNDYIKQESIKLNNSESILIEDLGLSDRAYNGLVSAKVKTVADILGLGIEGLMRYRNVGQRSITEIQDCLLKLNVRFI